MELSEKLSAFSFSDKEREKASSKFLPSLGLIDGDIKEKLDYLSENGVSITHAREMRVLCVTQEKLAEAFRIIGEVKETEMFVEDPIRLCYNPIDIYRKIKYCKSNNMSYRTEDGSYREFLFSEIAWKKELENAKTKQEPEPVNISNLGDSFVTLEPEIEDPILHFEPITPTPKEIEEKPADIISFADFAKKEEPVSMYDEPVRQDSTVEVGEPVFPTTDSETDELEANIAKTRKELAAQLSSALNTLNELKNSTEYDLSFDQIEPDMDFPTMGGR